jgi:hypothetical protein
VNNPYKTGDDGEMHDTEISAPLAAGKTARRPDDEPGERALRAGSAAGPPSSPAGEGQPLAPALEAAARDLYLALRTLAATSQQDAAGAVMTGKIRLAADAAGAAWQCLAGGHPAATTAMPGPGRALREAARRVAAASSHPADTAPGRDEVAAMAMVTLHSLAATATYLAWQASGLRASRLRNARDFLEAAAEHLREAIASAQAAGRAHRAAAARGDGEPGRYPAGHQQATSGQVPGLPRPPAARRPSRDMRRAMPRRKRLHYRIRELLAHRAWPRKRSG